MPMPPARTGASRPFAASIPHNDNDFDKDNPYSEIMDLQTLQLVETGRNVAFATAGDPTGTPVLFFYPAGSNRRQLVSLHPFAVKAALKLICVNRPGKGGTSDAAFQPHKNQEAPPTVISRTVCSDAAAVLDKLGVAGAVSLLFECAGAPFGLAFASQYPHRIQAIVGIGSWVLPSDCPEHTKWLFRFGALHCSNWLASGLAGNIISSFGRSFAWMPQSSLISQIKSCLTDEERDVFKTVVDEIEFVDRTYWMFKEKGGTTQDISVLLSKGCDIGLSYDLIPTRIQLIHADNDRVTPIAAVQWLAERLPSATLTIVPKASHEGTLFLLHASVVDSLTTLHGPACEH
jgi:pimeloyl-ACP methyl ester carboxylesterase